MNVTKKLFIGALAILLSFPFSSCTSEDPVPENDQELITDVILNFQELDADSKPIGLVLSFKASDSEGIETGQTPTVETVKLNKGKKYLMTIDVVNSIANEDITEEIFEEADEHQFYFLGTAFEGDNAPLTYVYDDPGSELLGLQGIVTSLADPTTNNAQLRVVLRHALDKNFPGASNPNFSDYASAGGESDLDITFPLIIE